MTITYNEISALVDAGQTPAEITATLLADTRHKRDVMATSSNPGDTDLLDVLGEYGLLWITPSATWQGPLVDAVAAQQSSDLDKGFGRLLANLQITNRPVRCGTISEIGYLTTVITQLSMAAIPAQAAAIQTAMNTLTGGLKYAGVTQSEVQACIDAHTAEVALQAVDSLIASAENDHINPAKVAANRTQASIAAAYRAAADAVEAG